MLIFAFVANKSNAQVVVTQDAGKQERVAKDFRYKMFFGVKAGMNISNVYDAQGTQFNAQTRAGFALGAFCNIPVRKILGVQPEILFSQKGFHGTGEIQGSTYNYVRTTNFIDVPIFLALKPSKYFTILAGPQFSYLIKQNDVYAYGSTTAAQEAEFENDNLRKSMLCVVAGFDVNYNHFVFSGRVGKDLQNNNGNGTSDIPRYKNVWYQITAGVRF